jgi:hypothetical protein
MTSTYFAMNNYHNYQPHIFLDKETRIKAEEYAKTLDNAIRTKALPYTGIFWRGASYSFPDNVSDTGERFTSVTTDPDIAIAFAIDADENYYFKTDGQIPNITGLQQIRVTTKTPFVQGNIGESECIFPWFTRIRFVEYRLFHIHQAHDAFPDYFGQHIHGLVFLTRVYEILGLVELSSKRLRVESCISCRQPATHLCSGCDSAYFCSDIQCKQKADFHLDLCAKN